MIARIWRGTTEAVKADEYFDYLNKTGIPDYRATEGNCGVYVLRRVENDKAHFMLNAVGIHRSDKEFRGR